MSRGIFGAGLTIDHVDCIVRRTDRSRVYLAEVWGTVSRESAEDYDSCTQRSDGSGTLCGWKDKVP